MDMRKIRLNLDLIVPSEPARGDQSPMSLHGVSLELSKTALLYSVYQDNHLQGDNLTKNVLSEPIICKMFELQLGYYM
jgi:hypothetical protein